MCVCFVCVQFKCLRVIFNVLSQIDLVPTCIRSVLLPKSGSTEP